MTTNLHKTAWEEIQTQMSSTGYRICMRCVMDTSDPEIRFDANGVCSHCHRFDKEIKPHWFPNDEGKRKLDAIVETIRKDGQGREYDCLLGLSGGVDSSYLAYLTQQWGLRTLGIHVDAGWNSEIAVKNIETIVKKCGIDLFTYVVNWQEMQDLQVAYLQAGLANQDIPQDHVFLAVLSKQAAKRRIKYLLQGNNFSTESILPQAWGHYATDGYQLKAIHKRFGKQPLKSYQTISFFEYRVYLPYVRGQRIVKPLNYLPYDMLKVKEILRNELGWKDYGVKHGESRFTRFFQNYYLPMRFGYDKRRAHFSSMILSGLMTREVALEELKRPLYDPKDLKEDKLFVSKKLGLSEEEFDRLINAPRKTFRDYPSNYWFENILRVLYRKFHR